MVTISIPEYDSGYTRLIREVMAGFVRADGLVGQVPRHRSKHGGSNRNVHGDAPLDHDEVCIEFEANIAKATIQNCDVAMHTLFIAQLSESHIKAMRECLLTHLFEVCDAAGQVKSTGGQPLGLDHLNQMLEMVSVSFDKDGNPTLPTLVISPDDFERLKSDPVTQEYVIRREEILQSKREQWIKDKRPRRLVLL